ncbi:MAG: hypothetical protein FJ026_13095, partial [Chloroflexi bacterium]|nr:hypothetical protein [Chloroflexota bacterium]
MSEYAEADLSLLKVAVVGAGQAAKPYGCAFTQLGPDMRIIGVADINEGRAIELAATGGAHAVADYRELLRSAPDIAL